MADKEKAANEPGLMQSTVGVLEKVIRVAAVLAFAAAGIAMGLNLPGAPATRGNPSFLDNVFASRITLFVARVLVVEGAIFLVFSMTIRTLQGDWATKAGPVDTGASNDLDDAVEDLASWKERATQAEAKVDGLETRLRETEDNLKSVLSDLETAEAKVHALEADGAGAATKNP